MSATPGTDVDMECGCLTYDKSLMHVTLSLLMGIKTQLLKFVYWMTSTLMDTKNVKVVECFLQIKQNKRYTAISPLLLKSIDSEEKRKLV